MFYKTITNAEPIILIHS